MCLLVWWQFPRALGVEGARRPVPTTPGGSPAGIATTLRDTPFAFRRILGRRPRAPPPSEQAHRQPPVPARVAHPGRRNRVLPSLQGPRDPLPLPGNPHPQSPGRRAPRHDNGWRAGCAGMRTSGSQGRPAQTHPRKRGQGAAGRPYTRVPTRHGVLLHRLRHGACSPAASSAGPPAAARGTDNAVGAPGQAIRAAQAPRRPMPDRPGPPQRPRIQVTCPSPTPDDSSTRAPVASAGAVGSSLRRRRRPGPGQAPASAGPVLARRPSRGRDDPRDRHRPVGELVQPHPTPPRQPRRPLTRRRRTPLPSQPHHHRGTRHGITNPPQNPGRSSVRRPGSRRCSAGGWGQGVGEGYMVLTEGLEAATGGTLAMTAAATACRPCCCSGLTLAPRDLRRDRYRLWPSG